MKTVPDLVTGYNYWESTSLGTATGHSGHTHGKSGPEDIVRWSRCSFQRHTGCKLIIFIPSSQPIDWNRTRYQICLISSLSSTSSCFYMSSTIPPMTIQILIPLKPTDLLASCSTLQHAPDSIFIQNPTSESLRRTAYRMNSIIILLHWSFVSKTYTTGSKKTHNFLGDWFGLLWCTQTISQVLQSPSTGHITRFPTQCMKFYIIIIHAINICLWVGFFILKFVLTSSMFNLLSLISSSYGILNAHTSTSFF